MQVRDYNMSARAEGHLMLLLPVEVLDAIRDACLYSEYNPPVALSALDFAVRQVVIGDNETETSPIGRLDATFKQAAAALKDMPPERIPDAVGWLHQMAGDFAEAAAAEIGAMMFSAGLAYAIACAAEGAVSPPVFSTASECRANIINASRFDVITRHFNRE